MAADTFQKRYSAINVGLPWRAFVDPTETDFSAGNRAAAAWLYSGVATEEEEPPQETGGGFWPMFFRRRRRR